MDAVISLVRKRLGKEGYKCSAPNASHPYEIWLKQIYQGDKVVEIRMEMADSKNCPTVECEILLVLSAFPEYSISFARLTQFCSVWGKVVNVELTTNMFFTYVQNLTDEAKNIQNVKTLERQGVHQTIHPILYPNPIRKTLTLERVSSKWKLNRKSERLDPKIPLNTLVKNRRKFSWSIYLEETQEESEAIKQLKQACVKQLDEDLEKRHRAVDKQKRQLEQL